MHVWRICRAPFAALDVRGCTGDDGARRAFPIVYTAGSLALAALEYLAHLDPEDVPDDLVAMRIEVPDDVRAERVAEEELPRGWNRLTEHVACIAAGDEWAARGEALVLRVPSAIAPEEENVLLNPRHPGAAGMGVLRTRRFAFDPRLLD